MLTRSVTAGLSIFVAVALAGVLMSSCEHPATQVLVHLDAQPVSRARAFTLRVTVKGSGMPEPFELDRALVGTPAEATFPVTVPVVPAGKDTSVTFDLTGELLDEAGECFSERKLRGVGFVADQLVEIAVVFSDACISIKCGDGFDCQEGECVPVDTTTVPMSLPEGLCRNDLCFEHPYPATDFTDACLYTEGSGYVVGRHVASAIVDTQWVEAAPFSVGDANAIACTVEGRVAVVGNSFVTVHEGGTPIKYSEAGSRQFYDAWFAEDGTLWVVGSEGTVATIKEGIWEETPWLDIEPAWDPMLLGPQVHAVWGDDGSVFIGAYGGLYRNDRNGWTSVPTPDDGDPDDRVDAIGGVDLNNWFVRVDSQVVRYAGTDPSVWGAGHSGAFSDVVGSPEGGMLLGFANQLQPAGATTFQEPTGFRYPASNADSRGAGVFREQFIHVSRNGVGLLQGASWLELIERESTATLVGLATHPDNPVYALAVGSRGTILKRIGPTTRPQWKRSALELSEDLNAVAITSSLAVVVGDAGTIAESTDGDRWAVVTSPTTDDLIDVHAHDDEIVAITASQLLRRDTATAVWVAEPVNLLGPAETLTSIVIAPDGAIYVGVKDTDTMAPDNCMDSSAPFGSLLRRSLAGVWTTVGAPLCDPVAALVSNGSQVWAATGRSAAPIDGDSFTPIIVPGIDPGFNNNILDLVVDADGLRAVLAGPGATGHTLRVREGNFTALGYAELRAIALTSTGELLGTGGGARVLRFDDTNFDGN